MFGAWLSLFEQSFTPGGEIGLGAVAVMPFASQGRG